MCALLAITLNKTDNKGSKMGHTKKIYIKKAFSNDEIESLDQDLDKNRDFLTF
jgi:hypothetical protein